MALIQAATDGDLAQAVTLLDSGADRDAVDAESMSAAHWAARQGHLHLLRLLRIAGADFRLRDNLGRTPFLGDHNHPCSLATRA